MMPVPRNLSSSCGTCVQYEGDTLTSVPHEVEQIVVCEAKGYKLLYRAEND